MMGCILLIIDTGRTTGWTLAGRLAGQGLVSGEYWLDAGWTLAGCWPDMLDNQ